MTRMPSLTVKIHEAGEGRARASSSATEASMRCAVPHAPHRDRYSILIQGLGLGFKSMQILPNSSKRESQLALGRILSLHLCGQDTGLLRYCEINWSFHEKKKVEYLFISRDARKDHF